MNSEQVLAASDVIAWLADQAGTAGEEFQKRVEMSLHLNLARLYLLEYASHLSQGAEPYDALLATVRGELQLSQRQTVVLKVLMPPREP